MEVYEKLIKGVRRPTKNKIALFLCGAAGTGKTVTRDDFLKDARMQRTYVYLNVDNVWNMLGKKGDISEAYNLIIEKVISAGYSFVYDGTCRNFNNLHKLIEYSKQKGYNVKIGIIYANLKTVLERLKKRKEQPLNEKLAKEIYQEFSRVANKYMNLDEIYLYNNDSESKLIYSKKNKIIQCIHPEMNFYFDVKDYC